MTSCLSNIFVARGVKECLIAGAEDMLIWNSAAKDKREGKMLVEIP